MIGKAHHNEASNDDNQYQRAGKEKKLFTFNSYRPPKKEDEETGPKNQKEYHLDPQLCGQLCKKFTRRDHFRASLATGQCLAGGIVQVFSSQLWHDVFLLLGVSAAPGLATAGKVFRVSLPVLALHL